MSGQRKYYGVDVKCPFYRHEKVGETSLTCEGFCRGSIVSKTTFETNQKKQSFMTRICKDRFEECPLFRAIMEKYDEHN